MVSGSPRCVSGLRGFTRLRPGSGYLESPDSARLRLSLWIEDTSRASGRCGGYNSSNTHTTQGGVGHNNIVHQQINTHTLHASPRQAQSAARGAWGKDASMHGEEPRTRAHRSNIMLHACTRTTDALPPCTHGPDPLPNHGLAVGVHLHLRCPSTGLKPNVSSATCPSVCRICLPVLMPYATTDPCAIRLRRLLGA